MPRIDTDYVKILSVSRNGQNNIEVNVEWRDANSTHIMTTGFSFKNYSVLLEFLNEQSVEDLARLIMLQCVRKTDGTFRGQFFDSMVGKTYEVRQSLVEVV